jgi:cytochrome P450
MHRPDKPAHLNFGGGIFSCIGRFAVTIEIEEVIAYMVTRYPDLRITTSAFSHSPMFTSVTALEGVLNG